MILKALGVSFFNSDDLAVSAGFGRPIANCMKRERKPSGLTILQRTIDALADHVAILNHQADITLVNRAWRHFAEANGLELPKHGLGVNYLELCDSVRGCEVPRLVASGIRKLLEHRRGEFMCEYPCHSPDEQRWFQVRGTCLVERSRLYLVLAHQSITRVKLAQEAFQQSEAKLRALLDATTESALLINLQGAVLAANATGAQRLQHSKESIVGKNLFALLPPDLAVERRARALQIIQTGKPVRFQDVREGRAYDVSGYPVLDAQGKVTKIAVFGSDISERKHAEERADWLASFPERNPNPIIEVDVRAGAVSYANPAARRLFPALLEQGLEHPWLAALKSAAEPLVSGRTAEVRHEVEVGNACYAQSITYVPQSERFRIYSIDITEHKQAEQALEHAQLALKNHLDNLEKTVVDRTVQLNAKVGELEAFTYSLSHDMRAPVRAMRGYCEIVRARCGGKMDPSTLELLDHAAAAALRLDRLILDVLALSRASSQRIALHRVDVEKLIRDVLLERTELQPPCATIEVQSPLLPMLGHGPSLIQCLSNLLSNATKFVAPGVHPRVNVYTEARGEKVRLWFQDNGIGISREDQATIFDMFMRLHSHEYEGTGIGLAIVRKAVQRMDGEIGLESVVGTGSKFWIELPRAL